MSEQDVKRMTHVGSKRQSFIKDWGLRIIVRGKYILPSLQMAAISPWIAAAILLAAPSLVCAGFESDFIPFPEVTVHYNDRDVPNLTQSGSDPLVDFFYTAKYNDWRLLSEVIISGDERDLERFIIGRVNTDGDQVWIGRNNTDLDQWNRLFHRETYLQTTIHRPGIDEFEDDGGVLPAHITGISLIDNDEMGGHTLNYGMTIGLGPALMDQHLNPYDLLKINRGSHDLAATGHVSYQAEGDSFNDSGLFAGYAIIPSEDINIREVKQTVVGAYTNYFTSLNLVWRASVFYIANNLDLNGGATKKESFGYVYLQPEYNLNQTLTLYGRLEASSGAKNDLYVQAIPSFVTKRSLVGARYQLQNSQVIKVEIAELEQYSQRFVAAEIQWSAAIP